MIVRTVVVATVVLVALSLSQVFALDCPKFPEQAKKDWEVKVAAEVLKIGPLKGAELKTTTQNATRDLFANLPDAGRVYLEQMMLATYCSSLRDDKTLTEKEKSKRLENYIREVRQTITAAKTSKKGSKKPIQKDSVLEKSNNRPSGSFAEKNVVVSSQGQSGGITAHTVININEAQSRIDTKANAAITSLQDLYPGGFQTFGFLISDSATAGYKKDVIKGTTSHNIDITWGSATVTELTPTTVTLQLQNLRIARKETTPGGTQPAGTIQLDGAAVWRIDRGTKLVSINNGLGFWGYVLGAVVVDDADGMLVIAMGLQKIQQPERSMLFYERTGTQVTDCSGFMDNTFIMAQ